jgi:putative nucleotidyltransferase with HDIG domain
MRLFQGRPLSPTFAPADIWTHSLSVAAATRQVAIAVGGTVADEAFLAGLLHDIGLMVELQVHRLKLGAVLTAVESGDTRNILDIEEATFGATHQDFGAGLLRAWDLPDSYGVVAGCHHGPQAAPAASRKMTLMVHLADRLVVAHAGRFLLDESSSDVGDDVLDGLRLTRQRLNQVVEAVPGAVHEAAAVFNAA